MTAQSFGPIGQIAYLVENLDSSLAHWSRYAGVGPWTVYRNVALKGVWRGQDADIRMNVGLSYQDGLQIELIEDMSSGPSPYRDAAGKRIIGMHHMAWMIADFDGHVERAKANGLTMAFYAENPVSKVAYFESADEPGILFEFIQTSPMVAEGFAQGIAASRDWDGKEHILQAIDFGG